MADHMDEHEIEELSDEELDACAGGYIFFNPNGRWEIIDEKGGIVATLSEHTDYQEARAEAARRGYKSMQIHWGRLLEIRKANGLA